MISPKDFAQAKHYSINDLSELPELAKTLREKYPDKPFVIEVASNCRGHIKFPYDNFYIKGPAKISDNLYARMLDENGEELTTWKTATIKISGSHNIFEKLSFINDGGDRTNKGQMVACAVYGDDNLFLDCDFVSTQDTLFVGPLPKDLQKRYENFIPEDERTQRGRYMNYFSHCLIEGDVDYIFGAGGAIFDRCELLSSGPGWIAAPSHEFEEDFGYLFNECHCQFPNIKEKPGGYFLARPWRDYGKVVFLNCEYGEGLNEEGFADWVDRHHHLSNPNDTDRTKTARFYEYPLRKNRVEWTSNKDGEEADKKYEEAVGKLRESL